ncbi:MAG: hypothetical protein HF975_04285 [ANME-2 cluster archaeon]|nr:hypothetical protein [ANME-2 cluster archaeon]
MLTRSRSCKLIELVDSSNIDHMVIRTGHGLLADIYDPLCVKPYMGLEGHTEAESKEAILGWNHSDLSGNHLHSHQIEAIDSTLVPEYHDSYAKHYDWQVVTLAPLNLELFKTTSSSTFAEMTQVIPGTTNMLRSAKPIPPFYHELHTGYTKIRYPFHGPNCDIIVTESMQELYLNIWKECIRVYYLFCETLDRKDAIDFMTRQYKKPIPTDTKPAPKPI